MSDLLAPLIGLVFAVGICAVLIAVGVARMRKRSQMVAHGVQVRVPAEQFIGQPLDILVDPQHPSVSAMPGRDRLGVVLVTLGLVFGVLVLGLGGLGMVLSAMS